MAEFDDRDGDSSFEPTVLAAIRQYWWLVAASVVVGGAMAFALVNQMPLRHEADAVLVVEDPRSAALFEPGARQDPERYVENQVEILTSAAVIQRAQEVLSQGDPPLELTTEDLEDGLTVRTDRSSDLIIVFFETDDPDAAIAAVNSISIAYQDVRQSEAVRSFSTAIQQLDTSISDLEGELVGLQDALDAVRTQDSVRQELEAQYQETLASIAELQQRTVPPSAAELSALRNRLDTMQILLDIESRQPGQAALAEQQRLAIGRLSELQARRDQLEVDAELAGGGVLFFSPAQEATEVGVGPARIVGVGLLVGLLVGVGIAYALALRRRRFQDRHQPEVVLGIPLLAEIPDFNLERMPSLLPALDAEATASAEKIRFVAAGLAIHAKSDDASDSGSDNGDARPGSIGTVLISSAHRLDGKTIVTANVAIASALAGRRVLAVDADFGHQSLTELLVPGQPPGPGLTEVAAGALRLDEAVHAVQLDWRMELHVLSRGRLPVLAPDFFNSPETHAFFATIGREYDLILVDSPPLLGVAYASALAELVDQVVVVVPHGSPITGQDEVRRRLEPIGTPFMGYIYNRAPLSYEVAAGEGSMADVLGHLQTSPTARRHQLRPMRRWRNTRYRRKQARKQRRQEKKNSEQVAKKDQAKSTPTPE